MFARIAAPLNQLLKNDQPIFFTPLDSNELYIMETLKNALISTPILALPYFGGHMTLNTDARNVQTDCVLLQKQPEHTTKPAEYWFCSFTDVEKRYDTMNNANTSRLYGPSSSYGHT